MEMFIKWVENVHSVSGKENCWIVTVFLTGIAEKCGTIDGLRRCHVLMCLRDLAATNECHKCAIASLFSSPKFAHLPVPQLYKETFVGIEDGNGDSMQKSGSC